MRFDLFLLFGFVLSSAAAAPVPVTIDAGAGMRRGGQPYFIKGAGGETRLDRLAAIGANSIRTWSTDGLAETLDAAAKHGLTVSAGIWLESECSWFSYANPAHCDRQTARVRQEILKHREHPTLLAWGLGNESEGDGTNAAYWQQIDRLAVMVKELDPAHPTFTAVAGLSAEKAMGLNAHAQHVDFAGVNTYGGLFSLRASLAKIGWTRPWVVTEWGPQGFWERPKSRSGAPLEQTSSEKAAMMGRGYDEVIAKGGACAGSYAFVWGWKMEATATWFGLLTPEGETVAAVDVLEERWTGRKPKNQAPAIEPVRGVPDGPLAPGTEFKATAAAKDPDGDPLTRHWSVLPESQRHDAGKKPKIPDSVPGSVSGGTGDEVSVRAPAKPGIYRLYVRITDGRGHAATANVPFEVK